MIQLLKSVRASDIREVFRIADEDQKGYLLRSDFEVACAGLLGYTPSNLELDQLSRGHAFNKGDVTLPVFTELVSARLNWSEDDLLRETFLEMDLSRNGFISRRDFIQCVRRLCPRVPEARLRQAFAEVDGDGDGRVSFRDFDRMMKAFR
ncbi:EF-hand [Gonapodya prolifera JEL478]|uniref:EF-hand n=1 Tax=Gonapodya prolifera (strain JEL478) TaxID=1344416 RepID=A0A139AYX5_GONPJ|nr:EF-hand [Gonapodya prolifera JEL478]|eukprot:KXS21675.1 EF-hand [Gonapodya prolifera JEL478]